VKGRINYLSVTSNEQRGSFAHDLTDDGAGARPRIKIHQYDLLPGCNTALHLGCSPCSMPDSNDFDDAPFRFDSVHNSAGFANHFSDTRIAKFWYNATSFREN
jgi:hypothetical protein